MNMYIINYVHKRRRVKCIIDNTYYNLPKKLVEKLLKLDGVILDKDSNIDAVNYSKGLKYVNNKWISKTK